jgi:hypothetical protein
MARLSPEGVGPGRERKKEALGINKRGDGRIKGV